MGETIEHRRPSTARPWLPEVWDEEADLVVVGYGGAGSCAAIAAHDAGQSVLVLEKAPVGGGNTGCCGGGMRIPTNVPNAIAYYNGLMRGVEQESIRTLAEAPGRVEHTSGGVHLTYWPVRATGDTIERAHTNRDYLGLVRAVGPGAAEVEAAVRAFRERHSWEIVP